MDDYDIEEAMGGSPEYNPFSLSDYINGSTIFPILISLAVIISTLVGLYKIFKKFGYSGYKAIIPIYNIIILTKIADKKSYYVLLCLIPIVNLYFLFQVYREVYRKMNLSVKYAILSVFFPFIMFPIVGFSKKIDCLPEYYYNGDEENVKDVNINVDNILNSNINMQNNNMMYNQNIENSNMINMQNNNMMYNQNMEEQNMINMQNNNMMYNQNMEDPNMMNMQNNNMMNNQNYNGQ